MQPVGPVCYKGGADISVLYSDGYVDFIDVLELCHCLVEAFVALVAQVCPLDSAVGKGTGYVHLLHQVGAAPLHPTATIGVDTPHTDGAVTGNHDEPKLIYTFTVVLAVMHIRIEYLRGWIDCVKDKVPGAHSHCAKARVWNGEMVLGVLLEKSRRNRRRWRCWKVIGHCR